MSKVRVAYITEDQKKSLASTGSFTTDGGKVEALDSDTIYITKKIPDVTVYTDEAGTTTTNVLRIYVDADGNLQIKTS